ncbi:LysM peptidoglycan-binding domain-containing protein [Thermomonospora amylolytica]|uniref:LysM peptidoglycan-binding domain-containing protein n=1 Tax=Thermomonospora amylolytica TaxID=1411117 RepID=UPI001300A3AD|nr:LysM peptidoglycan-binding domain-containing protein [Thermomonospora amylolytica]
MPGRRASGAAAGRSGEIRARGAGRRRALPDEPPVRLTRRGKAVVGLGVAGLMAGAFWLGMASGARSDAAPRQDAWVVVESGDTLWTIASRARPGRDPHATVRRIIEANDLGDAAVRPGQALRIPAG